jgi:alkyl hydroperoxide reductase subunit AhpC
MEDSMGVLVGKKAPSFTADAVVNGEFKKMSLSDYKGTLYFSFIHSILLLFALRNFTLFKKSFLRLKH